ncbi:MAG TPA: hypothetical protein VFG68_20390 [Fimbriiglobus sp.]|nr:hypothetical protein [Fimbriiglobus sp.]
MSILTRCPYCRRTSQAPARAVGSSGKCPSCGAWYTVTAEPGLVIPPPASEPEPTAAPLAPPAAPAPDPAPNFVATPAISSAPPPDDAPPRFRVRVHPAGLAACLFAGAGLVCAAFSQTAVLTWPLGAAGLLVGLVGVLLTLGGRPALLLFPAAGAIVSGGVLLAALAAPGLLGPRYEASRQRSAYDPEAVQVVPLSLDPAGAQNLEADGWVDASRAAIQQGTVRVQVTGAAVGPVRLLAPRPKVTKERHLTISLRVQHLGDGGPIEYEHWGLPAVRKAPPPTLEAAGRKLAPVELAPDQPVGRTDMVRLFPGKAVEDVLVFPAVAVLGSLRLELPAAAWGGQGVFRFSIPASMVSHRPAPRAGGPSPKGGR